MLFSPDSKSRDKVKLHSLFQSCKNPQVWSERFPSAFCMADDNGVLPPLVQVKDDDIFPMAFLFARKLNSNKQLEGPTILETSVDILCNAFESSDLMTHQLQFFRSNWETISITSSLARKFDLIGDAYNGIMSVLMNDLVSSGIEVISEDISSLQQEMPSHLEKMRSKSIIISPSAYSDFTHCYAMVEQIVAVFQNAKKQATFYFRQRGLAESTVDFTFFDMYQTHFEAMFQTMTSILWRTHSAGSRDTINLTINQIDESNDHTEYFFLLSDCIRITSLYFMLASVMNLAVMSIGDVFSYLHDVSFSEEARYMCSVITDSAQFEKIHPVEFRNRLMHVFQEKKELLTGFRKSLEFLFEQVNFTQLAEKFDAKLQEVAASEATDKKVHGVHEFTQFSSDLQEIIDKTKQVNQYLEKCFFLKYNTYAISGSTRKTSNEVINALHAPANKSVLSLMTLFTNMTNPSNELFTALHRHPEAFQANLALLRQRLDILYKDFMRSISLPIMMETTAFITSIADIDKIYVSFCYTTQMVKHMEEFKETRLGKLFLKQKKNSKRYSSYNHKDVQGKVVEVTALKQMRDTAVLHGLCYYSIIRRKCVSSSGKQELRNQVASHIYRQYKECLLEIFVEFLEFRDKRPFVFYETVLNFCVLLNQNALQTIKTYQAVLHK